jgi:hypothetical protein
MGIDIYGINPKNNCGESFGISALDWRSLATYACEVAPELTAKCKHWYTNDFDGLNSEESILLAELLQKEIDSGRAEMYARLSQYDGILWKGAHSYPFSVESLQQFVYFLRYCGGFEIC